MKTIGIAAKEGRTVVAFDVDPADPRIRFLRALERIVDSNFQNIDGDVILHCVRLALEQPDYTFKNAGVRGEWKALAFPILYGRRPPKRPLLSGCGPGSAEQRSAAMAVSFRLLYGYGPETLTGRLHHPRPEFHMPKPAQPKPKEHAIQTANRLMLDSFSAEGPVSWLHTQPRRPTTKKPQE